MLARKPTRIELKPEDREELFANKQVRKDVTDTPGKTPDNKQDQKGIRIGLTKAR